MSEEGIGRVLALAEERGLSHANLGTVDSNGLYRAKRYHVRHLRKSMTEGIAWLSLPSGLHPGEDAIPGNPFLDPAKGFADAVVVMDPESVREVPFDSDGRGLLLLGDYQGEMADHCVRALLAREIGRLAELGFTLYGGFEMEGSVLEETAQSLRSRRPDDVQVARNFDRLYSFEQQSGNAPFLDELLTSCEAMGLPIDTAHNEPFHMLEVGMRPSEGVRIADNAALYKSVAKIVAARHGWYVSFMARRHDREQGCGAHINVSLRHKATGETAFHDPAREDRLSDTLRRFLGGLARYLPELFLLLAPHLNSYKRFQPGLFTPLNNSWGINNKTVALRVVNATPSATRIEVRPAGADVSPHLVLLAVCAAGRLGIEQQIEPPAPAQGSGYDLEPGEGNAYPICFEAAIDAFAASVVAREVLSGGFVDNFLIDRRWQLEAFARTVTDWELNLFGNL